MAALRTLTWMTLSLALLAPPAAAAWDELVPEVGKLPGLEPPPAVPLPPMAPPLDTSPGGSRRAAPIAPDLVAPEADMDATWVVAGIGGALGLAGLAVWGGTRFRSTEDVLQHELRGKIYRYVEEHVGASLKDITEHLGLSTTNAVWHLRKLEDSGLVRGRKFNGAKVYYPTSGGVHARNLSLAGAALTSGNARTILEFVARHPGVHQREVARLLAVNHGTVRWHLKKLRDAELLEERRTGAHAAYHVTTLGTEALRAQAARSPTPASVAVPSDTALAPQAGQA